MIFPGIRNPPALGRLTGVEQHAVKETAARRCAGRWMLVSMGSMIIASMAASFSYWVYRNSGGHRFFVPMLSIMTGWMGLLWFLSLWFLYRPAYRKALDRALADYEAEKNREDFGV